MDQPVRPASAEAGAQGSRQTRASCRNGLTAPTAAAQSGVAAASTSVAWLSPAATLMLVVIPHHGSVVAR